MLINASVSTNKNAIKLAKWWINDFLFVSLWYVDNPYKTLASLTAIESADLIGHK